MTAAYLLDTHAALWLLEGSPKLGPGARKALETAAQETVFLSSISLLEIAMLARRGTIALMPDVTRGLQHIAARLTVLHLDAEIASQAVTIALPQRDPFDRVIAATARVHALTLITKDGQIAGAGVVETLW